MTSRGEGQRDYRKVMQDMIAGAPPPEITMLSDDPEDWESSGRPVDEDKIGKTFQVELNAQGKSVWREVIEKPRHMKVERFYISGTWNKWGLQAMEPHLEIPNLFVADIEVSEHGEELFNIVCDEDFDLTFFPMEPRCT